MARAERTPASARRRRGPPRAPSIGTDIIAYLRSLPPEARTGAIAQLGPVEREAVDRDWPGWAHAGQAEPRGDWSTWVIMAGRGFGKTLAGAHWVRAAAEGDGRLRIALVAATLDEARRVMVEGESGLLAVADAWIDDWSPSRRLLRFKGGAEAALFSGASPDRLRGPQHHLAWCDELAKWEKPRETWDMLQLGLRLGERPRALVTTTPRPGSVLKTIMAAPGAAVTRGTTRANPHLSPAYVAQVHRLYAGTRLERQELEGELLTDAPGALWTVELLEKCRIESPSRLREGLGVGLYQPALRSPECPPPTPPASGRGVFRRTVIGVDPPAGDGTCGIVACAADAGGRGHVLADHSVTARSPEGWARAVAAAAGVHAAALVVAEANQGGRMVEAVLRAAGCKARVRLVHASEGKAARADPVATLFEAGRVTLHGRFPELEAELCGLIAGGGYAGPGASPDRADAMVWALTELMLGTERAEPRVLGL